MRVALFTDTYWPQVNGVARTLERLVDHIAVRGGRVALISPRIGRRRARAPEIHIRLPGVRVPFYPELRMARPLVRRELAALEHFAPDIVHLATEFTVGWSGLRWAARHHVPVVSSFHTDFPAYLHGYGLGLLARPLWAYLRAFHAGSSVTLCPTTVTRGQLLERGFHDRLRIWPRGVDSERFHPRLRSDEFRERVAPGGGTILIYVGRLAPEKRLELLLDAFARARRRSRSRLQLVLVGDGPQARTLRQRRIDGVRFTGYLRGEALSEAYASADLFVFPSDTETFGNAVLEAMASGVAPIVVDRGGVVELVEDGRTGRVVPAGDAEALATAIVELAADGDRRRRLAVAARPAALERDWERILDDVLDEYRRVAGRRGALARPRSKEVPVSARALGGI